MIEQNFAGLKCDQAWDGAEGLKKIMERHNCDKCEPYKVAIVDINMPMMSGIEMMKKIKEMEILYKISFEAT